MIQALLFTSFLTFSLIIFLCFRRDLELDRDPLNKIEREREKRGR